MLIGVWSRWQRARVRLLRGWVRVLQRALARATRRRTAAWEELARVAPVPSARLATCKVCPLYGKTLPGTCARCGCFMPAKVHLAKARCPDGKWGPV